MSTGLSARSNSSAAAPCRLVSGWQTTHQHSTSMYHVSCDVFVMLPYNLIECYNFRTLNLGVAWICVPRPWSLIFGLRISFLIHLEVRLVISHWHWESWVSELLPEHLACAHQVYSTKGQLAGTQHVRSYLKLNDLSSNFKLKRFLIFVFYILIPGLPPSSLPPIPPPPTSLSICSSERVSPSLESQLSLFHHLVHFCLEVQDNNNSFTL